MEYQTIVGIDEVGRGPLAGPVVACALVAKKEFPLRDSKKLSVHKREQIYRFLQQESEVEWGIGRVSIIKSHLVRISEQRRLGFCGKSFSGGVSYYSVLRPVVRIFSTALSSLRASNVASICSPQTFL